MNERVRDIQFACFSLGDNLFAVDIMRIQEIIQPLKLSSLPIPSPFLEGVINLRGSVIPVMNLRKRFGMSAIPEGKQPKLLIVALSRRVLALTVDDVLEVITIPTEGIKPPPEVNRTKGVECLLGVCLSGEKVFMILDIDALLDPSDHLAVVSQAPPKV
ncbi:chemotaxis protein CheW [Pelotalea chapellei]|uniref:Chemotaxis protein CheW n=1 Tax=Pelotalea chapellei TaxID=44671 RepID=A0ABS5U7L1_9BACT|nr:chemotaxis protein CheW [Pelotalea chapellei]MBT1071647.1 chemotaxis protein CheW [Pelotalea chapellei]